MSVFKVDLGQLDSTITDLQKYSEHLDAELAGIDRTIATLQHSWTGEAATAQADAHRLWSKGAKNLHHSVRVMHQAAVTSHGNYSGSGSANEKVWGDDPS